MDSDEFDFDPLGFDAFPQQGGGFRQESDENPFNFQEDGQADVFSDWSDDDPFKPQGVINDDDVEMVDLVDVSDNNFLDWSDDNPFNPGGDQFGVEEMRDGDDDNLELIDFSDVEFEELPAEQAVQFGQCEDIARPMQDRTIQFPVPIIYRALFSPVLNAWIKKTFKNQEEKQQEARCMFQRWVWLRPPGKLAKGSNKKPAGLFLWDPALIFTQALCERGDNVPALLGAIERNSKDVVILTHTDINRIVHDSHMDFLQSGSAYNTRAYLGQLVNNLRSTQKKLSEKTALVDPRLPADIKTTAQTMTEGKTQSSKPTAERLRTLLTQKMKDYVEFVVNDNIFKSVQNRDRWKSHLQKWQLVDLKGCKVRPEAIKVVSANKAFTDDEDGELDEDDQEIRAFLKKHPQKKDKVSYRRKLLAGNPTNQVFKVLKKLGIFPHTPTASEMQDVLPFLLKAMPLASADDVVPSLIEFYHVDKNDPVQMLPFEFFEAAWIARQAQSCQSGPSAPMRARQQPKQPKKRLERAPPSANETGPNVQARRMVKRRVKEQYVWDPESVIRRDGQVQTRYYKPSNPKREFYILCQECDEDSDWPRDAEHATGGIISTITKGMTQRPTMAILGNTGPYNQPPAYFSFEGCRKCREPVKRLQ